MNVKTTGTIKFNNLKHVQHDKGHLVAVSRSGELSVLDLTGRERERRIVSFLPRVRLLQAPFRVVTKQVYSSIVRPMRRACQTLSLLMTPVAATATTSPTR